MTNEQQYYVFSIEDDEFFYDTAHTREELVDMLETDYYYDMINADVEPTITDLDEFLENARLELRTDPRHIYVQNQPEGYEVIFSDGNGRSMLARAKTLEEANTRRDYHRDQLAQGNLLVPDATV